MAPPLWLRGGLHAGAAAAAGLPPVVRGGAARGLPRPRHVPTTSATCELSTSTSTLVSRRDAPLVDLRGRRRVIPVLVFSSTIVLVLVPAARRVSRQLAPGVISYSVAISASEKGQKLALVLVPVFVFALVLVFV